VTGDPGVPPPPSSLRNQLAPACVGGCGRLATKRGEGRWCFWCAPNVSEEEKLAARRLGGRRGIMGSSEAALLLDGELLKTPAGRTEIRSRIMAARAIGKLGVSLFRDLLAGLDSAARDQERQGKPEPPPVFVEVQRFGAPPNGHENSP
jgi:hypothetical protein